MAAEPRAHRAGNRIATLVAGVRFRITAAATGVVAVVLAVAALAVLVAERDALRDSLDTTLRQRADDLQALIDTGTTPTTLAATGDDDTLAQIVGPDGTVSAASANIAGKPVLGTPPVGTTGSLTTSRIPHLDDDEFRILSRKVLTPQGETVVYVAGNLDDITEPVAALATTLAVAFSALLVVLGVLIWLVLGRVLRPVEDIRREAGNISASELHRRVPAPRTDNEIGRLARTMNDMLARLESSQARQQQLVADAAHELRSPLTNMRSALEVDLRDPDRADLVATHDSVLEEAVRLQHLVDDLLHLARSDARAGLRRSEPVDLDDLLLQEADRLRRRGRVEIDTTQVSAAQTLGDPELLERAIRNLADNAERHADSTVVFALRENGERAHLVVADDGPGIPADRRDQVFERFTRLDTARDREHGGSGLGLAITRDIIEDHQGTITLAADAGSRGARFEVVLPAATT